MFKRGEKVHCDGLYDTCRNCSRLGLNYSFRSSRGDDGIDRPYPVAEKVRVARACVVCHSLKVSCSGQTPKCRRGSSKGIACVYPPRRTRYPQTQFAAITAPKIRDTLPGSLINGLDQDFISQGCVIRNQYAHCIADICSLSTRSPRY